MKNLLEDLENCIKLGYSKKESLELLKILESREMNINLQKNLFRIICT